MDIVQDSASSAGLGDAGKRVMEQYELESEIKKREKGQAGAGKAAQAKLMETYGGVLSKPYEEFKPSQESMGGFAALGSLLMVAGAMMGGKGRLAGIGAMNNIAGMMKGYQQGRKDLYEQERSQFEQNMKTFEKNRGMINEAFYRALKIAPTNLKLSNDMLRRDLQALGASVPAEMVGKSGAVQAAGSYGTFHGNTNQTLDQLKSQLGRMKAEQLAKEADVKALGTGALEYGKLGDKTGMFTREQILQGQQKGQEFTPMSKPSAKGGSITAPVKIIGANGKTELITRQEFEERRAKGETITPAPTSATAFGGAVQQRYNSALTNAANAMKFELQNIVESPLTAMPPLAAEVLTNEKASMTQALTQYFAGKATPQEDRVRQQLSSALVRAQAQVLGGGRPGAMTEAAISEIRQQMDRAGDSKINTYTMLALAKQVLEVAKKDLQASGANEVQLKMADEALDEANRIIPFNMKDINRVLRGGGASLVNDQTLNLLQSSGNIGAFESEIEDMIAGDKAKTPKPSGAAKAESSYKSIEDVTAAYNAGTLDYDQAAKILKDQFGVQ